MKLVSLELQYFRQHTHTVIDLPAGLTGVIGPNGAGKSSIVEALAFALYGSRAIRGKLDDLKTWGADSGSECSVRLVFEYEGERYVIQRELSDALLLRGGESEPLARGARDVTQHMSALLRMNFEEFSATYFTEQKGLEFLSRLRGATERERFILRMLGYDRFERVQELLRGERRDLVNEIRGREASLGNRDDIAARLAAEQGQLHDIQKQLVLADDQLEKAEHELAGHKKRLKSSEARLEEYRTCKSQSENLAREVAEIAKRAQQAGCDAEAVVRAIAEFNADFCRTLKLDAPLLHALRPGSTLIDSSFVSSLQLEFETVHKELLNRESRCNKYIFELESQQQKLSASWQSSVIESGFKQKQARSELQTLLKRQQELQDLRAKGSCPTCEQQLGASFEIVSKRLQAEIEAARQKLDEIDQAHLTIETRPKQLLQIDSELNVQRSNLQRNIAALHKSEICRTKLESLQSLSIEREKLECDHKSKLALLDQANAKLAELGNVKSEHSAVKAAFDAAQGLTQVLRLQRVRLEGEAATKSALVERTTQDLYDYETRFEQLKQAREREQLLEECDIALIEFRKDVVSSLRPRLAEYASEFIIDLTDGRYTAVEVGPDFTPTVLDNGLVKNVISGGEEDILNLSMRLALSHLLAERAGHAFSFLILDEVFGSLDELRRANLLALLERLAQRFEQIIVITHLDDIKDGVRHLIYLDYDEQDRKSRLVGKSAPPGIRQEEPLVGQAYPDVLNF